MLNFSVKRLYRFDGEGPLKAVADVAIGEEFLVKGFRVVEGKKGIFVSILSKVPAFMHLESE